MRMPACLLSLPLLLVLFLPSVSTAQSTQGCTGTNAISPEEWSSAENFGIYEWSDWAGAWVLVEASFQEFAEYEELQPGEIYLPPETFDVLPPSTDVLLPSTFDVTNGGGCNAPKPMPPVVVTAPRPRSGGFLIVFRRIFSGGGGGGNSGIGRGAAPAPSRQPDYTCGTDAESRLANAVSSIRAVNVFAPIGSMWVVQYGNGQRETYRVTSQVSSLGAAPVSGCG